MSAPKLNRVHSNYHSFIDVPVVYEGSERYHAVPHRQVIETIHGHLEKSNISVNKERYLTDSRGHKAMGILDIGHIDKDMAYQIAWRNSLDGTMSFQVVAGSEVRICSNTNMWGEFSAKRKHLGTEASINIKENLEFSINSFEEVCKTHLRNKEILLNEKIDKTTAARLVGEMFIAEDLLKLEQISIIKREIENPSFDYEAKGTLYEFHNHITFALKNTHPNNWIKSHKKTAEYVLEYAQQKTWSAGFSFNESAPSAVEVVETPAIITSLN